MTKVITERRELYGFLATPGLELMNLVFANDDVWVSRKYGAEGHLPSLRHTNEVIRAYVTAGEGSICIAISTDCERMRSITTRSR